MGTRVRTWEKGDYRVVITFAGQTSCSYMTLLASSRLQPDKAATSSIAGIPLGCDCMIVTVFVWWHGSIDHCTVSGQPYLESPKDRRTFRYLP